MSHAPLASHAGASVYHCDWRELVPVVEAGGGADALIVDAPYSDRTHSGHKNGASLANKKNYADKLLDPTVVGQRRNEARYARYAIADRRREINYDSWSPDDVREFVATLVPAVRGWWVSLTDHVLVDAWSECLSEAGLYVFSPLACVESGSRVRMTGDGPAQWSCWAVVARPKGQPYSKWGSLPGAYVVPPGGRGEWRGAYGGERVMGGKPLWLMERLIEDYSRPGDLIVDPCCGGGTTLLAAQRTNRRAIGCDIMKEHAELTAKAISRPAQAPLFGGAT